MTDVIEVTKASGEREPFDVSKLEHSLKRAGAAREDIDAIVDYIEGELVNGISTQKIYKSAFHKLREISTGHAARYRIKEALFELGPSGYPFERFVAEMLHRKGFETKVSVIMQGQCVTHEVDVLAQKEQIQYMIECKFHNRPGYKCDVKVPLYIRSRFEDIFNHRKNNGYGHIQHKGWVVTNTRFSSDALEYGTCVGLEMLSWNHPRGAAIRDFVDEVQLHPITTLVELTSKNKRALIERDVIFCTDLVNNPDILEQIGISSRKAKQIINEAQQICRKEE
jgi:hypothetical protein